MSVHPCLGVGFKRSGGVGHKRNTCLYCSEALPPRARLGTCSPTCRDAHWKRRRRTAAALARKARCKTCGVTITRRADVSFCSPACRQAAYRARRAQARPAHQRPQAAGGSRWNPRRRGARHPHRSGARNFPEAAPFIKKHEWLGTMPAVSRHHFGLFFGERLGGVVVFGDEPAENLGVWDGYGFTGKIITLQRGACTHWAHPHGGSKLIRRAIDLLPARYQVVTAMVDAMAGEVGTVYQAAGFHYVGVMRGGRRQGYLGASG